MKHQIIILFFMFLMSMPFVLANLRRGPEVLIFPLLGLGIIASLILFAVYLIKWIMKELRTEE